MTVVALLAVPNSGGRAQADGRSNQVISSPVPGNQLCCDKGNGWAPGEPSIAVSRKYVVETVNASITVFLKSSLTIPLFHAAFYDFFGGSSNIACVDPRVIYWSWDNRFAVACLDIASTPNVLRFAVSASSDPTDAWHKYQIADSGFLDQPKIMATQDKLVVAGNGNNNTTQFYVYEKMDVVRGQSQPRMTHLTSNRNLYQAVLQYTRTDNASFIVSYSAGSTISLATITGTPARANVALQETILGISTVQYPSDPAIPGGRLGGALDPRINNAVYEVETSDRKPVIQYSQSAECVLDGLSPTVCIATGRIDMSASPPVLKYQTLIGAAGSAYTYGAVTLDGYGRVYAAYSRSSSTAMPSAAVLGGGSPTNTFDTIIQPATAGTACTGSAFGCDERWGDYLGATQDPVNRSKVWLAALYQAGNGTFGWGTVVVRASPAGIENSTATDDGQQGDDQQQGDNNP